MSLKSNPDTTSHAPGSKVSETATLVSSLTAPQTKRMSLRWYTVVVEIARLIEMGARRIDVGQDESDANWTVLADPEGNEFCVLSSRDQ